MQSSYLSTALFLVIALGFNDVLAQQEMESQCRHVCRRTCKRLMDRGLADAMAFVSLLNGNGPGASFSSGSLGSLGSLAGSGLGGLAGGGIGTFTGGAGSLGNIGSMASEAVGIISELASGGLGGRYPGGPPGVSGYPPPPPAPQVGPQTYYNDKHIRGMRRNDQPETHVGESRRESRRDPERIRVFGGGVEE